MKPFTKYIPKSNLETPMSGKRMGERLQWLNSQINKLNELFNKVKNIIYECLSK